MKGLVVLLPLATYGQDDCYQQVLKHIDRMAEVGLPTSQQVYFMDYSVEDELRGGKKNTVRLKVYMTSSQMVYETPSLTIMQDADDAFMILPNQHQVIWGKGVDVEETQERTQKISKLQKAVLEGSKTRHCSSKGQDIGVLQVVPSTAVRETHSIDRITYYYNYQTEQVDKAVITYQQDQLIQKKVIVYHTVSFNYKKWKVQPVRARVLNKENRLLAKYKGYTLVDSNL